MLRDKAFFTLGNVVNEVDSEFDALRTRGPSLGQSYNSDNESLCVVYWLSVLFIGTQFSEGGTLSATARQRRKSTRFSPLLLECVLLLDQNVFSQVEHMAKDELLTSLCWWGGIHSR